MTKKRPFGVTLLALLATVGAIIAIVHTLQMLHLFPISGPFGQFKFFTFDLFGALMWGILALIYIWVVRMLWNLDPQGWLFVVAIAALNLIFAVVSIFGASSWQAMMPAIIINGLILLYGLMPSTKEAFGVPTAEAAAAAAAEERSVEVEAVPEEEVAVEEAAAVEEVVEAAEPEMGAEAVAAAVAAEAAAVAAGDEAQAAGAEAPQMDPEAVARAAAMVTGAAAASHDLKYVADMGEENAGKLIAVGVDTPQALLERGATPQGRRELANETGIDGKFILRWINEVDLYRITGLGREYANLLETAGVDTVPELAQRNAANLYAKVVETNEEKQLVKHLPSEAQVEDWVSQAKGLPRVVSY